jgi:hypothetical protein
MSTNDGPNAREMLSVAISPKQLDMLLKECDVMSAVCAFSVPEHHLLSFVVRKLRGDSYEKAHIYKVVYSEQKGDEVNTVWVVHCSGKNKVRALLRSCIADYAPSLLDNMPPMDAASP